MKSYESKTIQQKNQRFKIGNSLLSCLFHRYYIVITCLECFLRKTKREKINWNIKKSLKMMAIMLLTDFFYYFNAKFYNKNEKILRYP